MLIAYYKDSYKTLAKSLVANFNLDYRKLVFWILFSMSSALDLKKSNENLSTFLFDKVI